MLACWQFSSGSCPCGARGVPPIKGRPERVGRPSRRQEACLPVPERPLRRAARPPCGIECPCPRQVNPLDPEFAMDRRNFLLTAGTLAAAVVARGAATTRSAADHAAGAAGSPPAGETGVAAFAAERRFANLPQGRVAYVDRGRGPAALFLHGFPLNGYQWRGALDRLSMHRRCIVPDVVGLGYSEPGPGQDLRAPAQVRMIV